MDAQHVICAGRVRHAARQTDATCHKSAVQCSRVWQVIHSSPFSKSMSSHCQQQRSQECCQEQSVAVRNEREVVFFGLIFSMVGLGWGPLLVAQQHMGSLVADHWVLALFLPTVLLGLVQVLGPSISEYTLPRPPDHLCGMDDPLPSCQTYPSGASVSFLHDP